MNYPLVKEIEYKDPVVDFSRFAAELGALFLDSAKIKKNCGRYSFIALAPFEIIKVKNSLFDPLQLLEEKLRQFPLTFHVNLPPFQGGAAGYFSYDLGHYFEKLPRVNDAMQFSDLIIGLYDLVIAYDHELQQAWIFSSGYPEQASFARQQRAEQRLNWLLKLLRGEISLSQLTGQPHRNKNTASDSTAANKVGKSMLMQSQRVGAVNSNYDPVTVSKENESILMQSPRTSSVSSNFTAASYAAAVTQVKEYILAGDIFEANISQCFQAQLPSHLSEFDLYLRLRAINPAPFAAFLNFGDTVLASASPERFLQLIGKQIETRPIKGTCARSRDLQQDKILADELLKSSKDRAENIMIVDLLRNDLSRVCEDHTVKVPVLCGLESYASVHHLVSVVVGTLKSNYSAIDLLRVTFPGGSITGAPKIRAMEIIAEIEGVARGPYCGSIGYIGFNGDMDISITIRTYSIKDKHVVFQAGGAITLDSDPVAEYAETLTKAKALLQALT